MQLHQRRCQRKSDTRTRLRRMSAFYLEESFENTLPHIRWNRRTVILHGNPENTTILTHRQYGFNVCRRIFNSIIKEITTYLRYSFFVHQCHHCMIGTFQYHLQLLPLTCRDEAIECISHQYIDIPYLQRQRKRFRLYLTEIQQLIHQHQQPICVPFHCYQVLFRFMLIRMGGQNIIERRLDQCYRSSYLMCNIRKEVYFSLIYFLFLLLFLMGHFLIYLPLLLPYIESDDTERHTQNQQGI